jgi:hypothetical protein
MVRWEEEKNVRVERVNYARRVRVKRGRRGERGNWVFAGNKEKGNEEKDARWIAGGKNATKSHVHAGRPWISCIYYCNWKYLKRKKKKTPSFPP